MAHRYTCPRCSQLSHALLQCIMVCLSSTFLSLYQLQALHFLSCLSALSCGSALHHPMHNRRLPILGKTCQQSPNCCERGRGQHVAPMLKRGFPFVTLEHATLLSCLFFSPLGCSVLGRGAEPLVRTQFLEHPPTLNFGANHLKKWIQHPQKPPIPFLSPHNPHHGGGFWGGGQRVRAQLEQS